MSMTSESRDDFIAQAQSPFALLRNYESQSLLHDPGSPTDQEEGQVWRGIAYRIGSKLYASEFAQVAEIISLPPVTPLPGAKPWMLGVANVRGSLFPMVDLQQFLGGERTVLQMRSRALVLSEDGNKVGILIDELLGQRSCRYDETYELENDSSDFAELFDAEFETQKQTYTILNLKRLASLQGFLQAAQE